MKEFPTLYKKTKTGKIQQWLIKVEPLNIGAKYMATIITNQGQVDGKKQIYKETIDKGKNLEKSNNTTPYEQACLEAESKWNKKKDEGYKEIVVPSNWTIEQTIDFLDNSLGDIKTDADGNPKPMLAQSYKKNMILGFPIYGQPKYNGVRCLASIDRESQMSYKTLLFSRGGKTFMVDHIQDALFEKIAKKLEIGQSIILDGEIYCHGLPLNKIVAAVKKPNEDTPKLVYCVYDMVDSSMDQVSRNAILISQLKDTAPVILHVNSFIIESHEDIKTRHDMLVSDGYEGIILRNPYGRYEIGHRSKYLLKVKEFIDEEFEILGGELGARGTEDMVFTLKAKNGNIFKAKPKGDRVDKEEYYNNLNNLIGKQATVRYFELTEYGIPFHGHVTVIRDYEH